MFKHHEHCFGCGDNPIGLRLQFGPLRDQELSATFETSAQQLGPPGLIHGGILATALDEALAQIPPALGIVALTKELTVRYHRRVYPGMKLRVVARVVSRGEGQLALASQLFDAAGHLLAEAQAVFREIDPAILGLA